MRRIGRASAVLVAAMACLSFSAVGASASSAATAQPASHALQVSSSAAHEAAAQASGAVQRLAALHGAQAVVPDALGAVICQGDVCIQSQCAHCDTQSIRVWANTTTFTGHFEIIYACSMAGCVDRNSPNATWKAHGTGHTFGGVPAAAGNGRAKAWKGGPPWHALGDVTFYLL
jgi:hypothetical protein